MFDYEHELFRTDATFVIVIIVLSNIITMNSKFVNETDGSVPLAQSSSWIILVWWSFLRNKNIQTRLESKVSTLLRYVFWVHLSGITTPSISLIWNVFEKNVFGVESKASVP